MNESLNLQDQEFMLQESYGKYNLLYRGQRVGAALEDRGGYWDAEIAHRVIGRFKSPQAACKALWEQRQILFRRNWHEAPYYEH